MTMEFTEGGFINREINIYFHRVSPNDCKWCIEAPCMQHTWFVVYFLLQNCGWCSVLVFTIGTMRITLLFFIEWICNVQHTNTFTSIYFMNAIAQCNICIWRHNRNSNLIRACTAAQCAQKPTLAKPHNANEAISSIKFWIKFHIEFPEF